MNRSLVFFVASVALCSAVVAKQPRSAAALLEFKRHNPCPSTGQRRGACPNHVIDHKQGICVGGQDTAANMMWMTPEAARRKDRWECKPGWQEKLRACLADQPACTGVD